MSRQFSRADRNRLRRLEVPRNDTPEERRQRRASEARRRRTMAMWSTPTTAQRWKP